MKNKNKITMVIRLVKKPYRTEQFQKQYIESAPL